jgi:hypothetical protein
MSVAQHHAPMESTTFLDRPVALFANLWGRTGHNVPLHEILRGIRCGQWKSPIETLRALEYAAPEYSTLKRQLPCFMASASTRNGGHKGDDIDQHTGLLQTDLDDIGAAEAPALRNRLGEDPHVLASFLSPGGHGVKAIMCIPADIRRHRDSFRAAQLYMRQQHGVEIDELVSDPSRLCFISHDPELRINESAVPLHVHDESGTIGTAAGGPAQTTSSTFLPSASASASAFYLLHNNTALFEQFPALRAHYETHVVLRLGAPQPGLRNDALVELVAELYCVLHPKFVLAFAATFYRLNAPIFADYPFATYMNEARSVLDGCAASYPIKRLSADEADIYGTLRDEDERVTFRICRSLAACESDPTVPPPLFFLAANRLGARLGVLDTPAWRILVKLEKHGVIQTMTKGQRRAKGIESRATIFRWLLGSIASMCQTAPQAVEGGSTCSTWNES